MPGTSAESAEVSRDLAALFDPASIAVVGASTDPAKWGNAVALQALRGSHRHRVQLVNRSGGEILGIPTVASVAELDGPIDLAVIAVPEAGFEDAVDGVLAKGARAIVAITAGLGEAGATGRAREDALIARVRNAGAVLIGPNCLGLVDNTTATYLSSNQFAPGDVAVLSQSGNLAIELDRLFTARGLGISRFVSLGNQAHVSLVDLIDACAADPATSAIAVYIEDFRDGRGFVDAAGAAVRSGTPVVVLAAGASTAASRGAQSHTGSLTSDSAVTTAACAVAGATLVRTPRELANVLLALKQQAVPRGRRVAVLTDGGGHGVIACDVAEAAGLDVPALGEATQVRLRDALWSQSNVGNPVDLAGAGEIDPDSYARAFAVLQDCDEVDAILMTGYFGGYSSGEDGLTGLGPAECAAAKQIAADSAGAKPTAVQSIFPDAPACQILRDGTVPVLAAIEDAAAALAAVTEQAPTAAMLALPEPAQPVTATDYRASRSEFAAAGIDFVAAREVRTGDALAAAADELRPPFVLKALGLLHKSDAGGVVVGLASREALVDAHARLVAKLDPPSFSVEEMADLKGGVELIVGARWDPRFGPTVLVGMGGTATEVLRDVLVALAPVDEAGATRMLERLRTAALLHELRGRPAVNIAAAARTVARLSEYAAAHPEIAELEINPLLVTPSGATALDARIVKHQ
jgi:acyl-CoA synthetase (NDP forming)